MVARYKSIIPLSALVACLCIATLGIEPLHLLYADPFRPIVLKSMALVLLVAAFLVEYPIFEKIMRTLWIRIGWPIAFLIVSLVWAAIHFAISHMQRKPPVVKVLYPALGVLIVTTLAFSLYHMVTCPFDGLFIAVAIIPGFLLLIGPIEELRKMRRGKGDERDMATVGDTRGRQEGGSRSHSNPHKTQ